MNAIYPDQPMTARRARMIAQKGEGLVRELERLGEGVDLPEWIQAKIESSYQMIDSAFDYLEQMDEITEITESDLLKARATKYTYRKRVGTNPKTGAATYRYFYNKPKTGKGIQSRTEDIKEGAAFVFHHNGQRGHFHVEKVKGKKLTIVHDETGHSVDVTQKELYALLLHEHKKHLEEHAEHTAKRAVERGRKTKSGTHKGAERRAERAAELAQEAKSARESVAVALGDTPKKEPAKAAEVAPQGEPAPSADNFETMPDKVPDGSSFSRLDKRRSGVLDRYSDEQFNRGLKAVALHMINNSKLEGRSKDDLFGRVERIFKPTESHSFEHQRQMKRDDKFEELSHIYFFVLNAESGHKIKLVPPVSVFPKIFEKNAGAPLESERAVTKSMKFKDCFSVYTALTEQIFKGPDTRHAIRMKGGEKIKGGLVGLFEKEIQLSRDKTVENQEDAVNKVRLYLEGTKDNYVEFSSTEREGSSPILKTESLPSDIKGGTQYDQLLKFVGLFYQRLVDTHIENKEEANLLARYAESPLEDKTQEELDALKKAARVVEAKGENQTDFERGAVRFILNEIEALTNPRIKSRALYLGKTLITSIPQKPEKELNDAFKRGLKKEPTPSADNFETMPKVEAVPTSPTSPAREELAEATAGATPSADNFETMPKVEAVPTAPSSPAREELAEATAEATPSADNFETMPEGEFLEHPQVKAILDSAERIDAIQAINQADDAVLTRLQVIMRERRQAARKEGERLRVVFSEPVDLAIKQSLKNRREQPEREKAQTEREQAIASLDQPLELAGIKPSDLSLEDAISSYRGTSWQYERRGQDDLLDFQRDLKNLERKGFEYIKQGAPRSEVAYVISTGAQKMLDARRALNAARSRTMSAMITGRGNFPVRSQRKKMDVYDKRLDEYVQAGARTLKQLKKLDPKTPQPIRQGSGVSAYETKLAKLEALQEAYKEKRREASAKGLKPNDVIPRYLLTNNSAQIRRVREQIREEEERKKTLDSSEKFEDYTLPDGLELQVEKDQSDNRLRLHLSDKPDAETRRKIKARGFKWSRLNSAWQRILTSNALAILPLVLAELGAKKESEESEESVDNFETMPEVEEQQAPSKLSEEAQAAFQNLDKILGTLERMESTQTPAGRIKNWYDVKMYRDEFAGYLNSLFRDHGDEITLDRLSANDNYSSGKLFIYKPAKSTATAEEVAEAHRERRAFLKLVRKTFEETVTKETEAPTPPTSPAREELAEATAEATPSADNFETMPVDDSNLQEFIETEPNNSLSRKDLKRRVKGVRRFEIFDYERDSKGDLDLNAEISHRGAFKRLSNGQYILNALASDGDLLDDLVFVVVNGNVYERNQLRFKTEAAKKYFEDVFPRSTKTESSSSPAREELAQATETAIQASQPKAEDMSDEELTSAIRRQDAEVLDLGTEIDELKRQRKPYKDKSKQRKEAKARLNELKTAQASRKGEKVELKGEGANVPPENEMKAMISKLQTMVENNPSLAKSPEIMALLGGGATQASDLPDTDLVITLGGKTQNLPVRYKIVEAGDAIGSHNAGGFYKRTDYPEGIQEREYHNARGPEQNKVIVQAQNLNPQLLANTNPDAMNGPPILTQDGIALGGNSRVMSVQRAYLAHPDKAKAYKAYLYKKAHTFGIDPNSLDQFSAPLLVRELVVEDKSKENLSKLVRAMNEGLTQEFDATAEGRNAATKLLGENVTLKAIASALRDSPESATINSILKTPSTRLENIKRALFRDGIMTSRNSNKYIHEASGAFNDTGVSLVKKMITGYVLRDDELLRALSPRTEDNLNNALATLSAVGINREDANAVQDAVFIYNLILNKDIETGGINSAQSPQERDKRIKMYIEEDRAFDFGSGVSDKINIERMKDRVKKNPLSSAFLKILALNPTPRALNSTMKQFVKLVDVSDNMDMFAAAPIDFTTASKQIAQKLADQHNTSAELYKSHRGRGRFGSARLELLRALA